MLHKENDIRSMKTSIAVASILLAAQANAHALEESVTLASAESAADSDRKIGEFLDLNDDHKISYDEFVHSMAEKAMREMDADKDDTLTPAETAAARAKGHPDIAPIDFRKADTNGDGQVSAGELEQALRAHPGVRQLFQNHDKDGDGYLDGAEVNSIGEVPLIRFHF
jgi:Ca2+-binding EF-hand superfamily protein